MAQPVDAIARVVADQERPVRRDDHVDRPARHLFVAQELYVRLLPVLPKEIRNQLLHLYASGTGGDNRNDRGEGPLRKRRSPEKGLGLRDEILSVMPSDRASAGPPPPQTRAP